MNCNHVKLDDVPDMNYFSVNNEGEVGRLHPVIMSRQSWWRRFYQKGHTIVSRLGIDSFEIFSRGSNISGTHFPSPDNGDLNMVLFDGGNHQRV